MLRWVLYWLAKFLAVILLALLGPVRVVGRRNVPRRGGLLVLSNHISDADPVAVGHALPRTACFMAKSELFSVPVFAGLIRALGAFPVRRWAPDRAAIRRALELLKAGEAVVMFPEGQLSEDGKLQAILPGAALIIKKAGVPAVCCGLVGTNKIMPFRKLFPRPAFGGVRARFGEPRRFDRADSHEAILGWIESELRRLTGQ
ncbi:MAG: 1-acyl-sn-glycerol-3-phosphate acyltransferase [Armatimonadetes bacterium]|nr:1-acyl-sn-glycerol-3-phosphate acyltransferase [Armatimonadota bacterium]